jgi:uncharacterized protein (TIGR02246 family)
MERTDLLAHESIRGLLAAYTWAGDRGDAEGVAACFTEEGALDVGEHGGRWVGQEAIARELRGVIERAAGDGPPVRLQHHVSSVAVALDGHDAADVRSYFVVLGPNGIDHWGRYRDRVVETAPGGPWIFEERVVIVDGRMEGSILASRPSPAP